MKIREMRDGDTNFILSTWLKSYYEALRHYGQKGCPYPKDDVFFQGHQAEIKNNLSAMSVMVCVAPDDENQIIGWLAHKGECLHYVYVKQVFRKLGVAKALIKQAPASSYSHHTRFSKYICKGLTYDPYKF